jgi:hypothetical protein
VLALLQRKAPLILGPYTCTEGFRCTFTVDAIFLPVPEPSYD